jgi:hypothetical protein
VKKIKGVYMAISTNGKRGLRALEKLENKRR